VATSRSPSSKPEAAPLVIDEGITGCAGTRAPAVVTSTFHVPAWAPPPATAVIFVEE